MNPVTVTPEKLPRTGTRFVSTSSTVTVSRRSSQLATVRLSLLTLEGNTVRQLRGHSPFSSMVETSR